MLKTGQPVPDFELPDQDGRMVKLSHYRGRPVVIFAFPRAGTLGCNNQACSFRDAFPQIRASDAAVLGISPDDVATLKEWKQSKKLQYDLLSDPEHNMLTAWGAWGYSLLGLISVPMARRSYWVIDENGLLMDQKIDVGPQESVQLALEALARYREQASAVR